MVKISEAAVGIIPTPAPFENWPKKIVAETIDQTNQVYGCGWTRPLNTSNKYGKFPATANTAAIIAIISFVII